MLYFPYNSSVYQNISFFPAVSSSTVYMNDGGVVFYVADLNGSTVFSASSNFNSMNNLGSVLCGQNVFSLPGNRQFQAFYQQILGVAGSPGQLMILITRYSSKEYSKNSE